MYVCMSIHTERVLDTSPLRTTIVCGARVYALHITYVAYKWGVGVGENVSLLSQIGRPNRVNTVAVQL
jgi:hypothetical protein